MSNPDFLLSTTVDFPDDCNFIVFTEDLLAQLMDRIAWLGVRRVYWNYYQKPFWQAFARIQSGTRQSIANLGDPMTVGCRLAHERGMDFIAIIKPYETGVSHAVPAASPEGAGKSGLPCIGGVWTAIDPWVMAHPELRVKGRSGSIPAQAASLPVTRIQLRQRDTAPTRITVESLEIWTSADNLGYQKQDVAFTLTENIETCPRPVEDVIGNPVTHRGDPVRVLNIHLREPLSAPFIVVTTNFDSDKGTFQNTAAEMLHAFGPDDQPLPIVVASQKAVWTHQRDFQTGNLEFDCGHGDFNVCLDVTNRRTVCPPCLERGITDCMQSPIFADTPICRDGLIAFARGRNTYVGNSLCEAYPEVQAYWLDWVSECLVAGVDGVDWRISNHSSWTNTPEIYGFNEPVIAEYQRRYGANPDVEPFDPALLGALRGEFYDQFLRKVRHRLAAAGKSMHVQLELESFRPDAPQARVRTRPGNIDFNWRRWLRTGLIDEATLMAVQWMPDRVLNDAVAQDMMQEAAAAKVPVYLRNFLWASRDGQVQADRLEYAYRFGGLSGYNLYEAASMYDTKALGADGRLDFYPGFLESIRSRAESLGLV